MEGGICLKTVSPGHYGHLLRPMACGSYAG